MERCHLTNTQHDFRSGSSCLSALLSVFNYMMPMRDNDFSVDIVYLDFSNTFNKVYHGILLHELRDLDITGELDVWVFQFQTNLTL